MTEKEPKEKRPIPEEEDPETEVEALRRQGRGKIESDVLGSYTGTPKEGDVPEQDPDDL